MTKFIVLVSSTTIPQHEKVITDLLAMHGAWWHWFAGSWLFSTNKYARATKLRDAINEAFIAAKLQPVPILVLRVDVDSSDSAHWGGYSLPTTRPNDSGEQKAKV